MPIILIIVGIVTALGVGSFMFLSKPQDTSVEVVTSVAQTENNTASNTLPTTAPATDTNLATNTAPTTLTTVKPIPVTVTPEITYKDGNYTVTTSYTAPSRTTHDVTTTLKIVNDVVTEARVNFGGEEAETSSQYQSRFSQNYQSEVVGKKLDSISLTRVGGASLTTGAFNKALVQVKAEARS